jgi:hypothetical protein
MIKGQALIEVKELNEKGELITVNSIAQNNTICVRALEQLLTFPSPSVFNNGTNFRIVISSSTANTSFSIRTLTSNILASGDKTAFPTDNYLYTKRDLLSLTNPSDVVYKQRFVAPTANRTINSIALSDSIALQNNVTATANVYTYLKLAAPITQTTSQTLDISYRLYIDWTNAIAANMGVNVAEMYESFLIGTAYNNNFLITGKLNTAYYNPNVGINTNENISMLGGDFFTGTQYLPTNNVFANSLTRQNTGTHTINLTTGSSLLGRFVSNFSSLNLFRTLANKPTSTATEFNKTSNLGSITSHAVTSNLAIYDTNNLANSSWQPIITNPTTPDFPSFYILRVTQAGGLGTGRYKLYKSGWGGWSNGAWSPAIADPFLSVDLSYQQLQTGFTEDNYSAYNPRWLYTWSSTLGNETFVSYVRDYGVGIYTLTDRNLILNNLWKVNLNGLGNYINQIAVSPVSNKIYVAANNGLYEINVGTNTISTLSSDKCLAVCVGFNEEVFAAFNTTGSNGRLSSSIGANWSTALNIGSPTPAINWANIWRLYIDKENNDYQMMIIEGGIAQGVVALLPASTSTKFIRRWWSNAGGGAVVGTNVINNLVDASITSDLMLFPSSNAVLGSRGIWVYNNVPLRSLSTSNISCLIAPKDLETDITNNGLSLNKYRYYHSSGGTITKGTGTLLNISFNKFLDRGVIHVGLFNATALLSFTASGNACGDWIKPRLATDGNIFSVVFTICNHNYNAVYQNSDNAKNNNITQSSIGTFASAGADITAALGRVGVFAKVNIDLTSTPTATLIDYTDIGTSNTYSLNSANCSSIQNVKVTHDKRIILFDPTNSLSIQGVRMYSPIHVPSNDLNDLLVQSWSWDSGTSTWVNDPLNNGVGKPLHTTTDLLVDGMSINWTDLQPGDSKPLIANQYYVFTKITAPGQVPIEAHTPAITLISNINLRLGAQGTTTISIPNTTTAFYIKEHPLGTNPNTNYYNVAFSPSSFGHPNSTCTIDSSPAPFVLSNNITPPAGTVYLNENGRIRVSSADINKTLVLNYTITFKYDATEDVFV